MHVLLPILLALPTALPTTPYDGTWTIMSVEHNGKKTDAYAQINIRDGRFVLGAPKGEAPVTVELEGNHRAWVWSGPSKTRTIPGYVVEYHYPAFGEPLIDRMQVPARTITLAQLGFHVEQNGQLQIFFVPQDGKDGPSLTLTLRRESVAGNSNGARQPAQ